MFKSTPVTTEFMGLNMMSHQPKAPPKSLCPFLGAIWIAIGGKDWPAKLRPRCEPIAIRSGKGSRAFGYQLKCCKVWIESSRGRRLVETIISVSDGNLDGGKYGGNSRHSEKTTIIKNNKLRPNFESYLRSQLFSIT